MTITALQAAREALDHFLRYELRKADMQRGHEALALIDAELAKGGEANTESTISGHEPRSGLHITTAGVGGDPRAGPIVTPEMMAAGEKAWMNRNLNDPNSSPLKDCYLAMLAAAHPTLPADEVEAVARGICGIDGDSCSSKCSYGKCQGTLTEIDYNLAQARAAILALDAYRAGDGGKG